MSSLSATLYQAFPDVFPVSTAAPIPSERPTSLVSETRVCDIDKSVWEQVEGEFSIFALFRAI
jgi:hypothetical protein